MSFLASGRAASGSTYYKVLKVGAGGNVTNLDCSPDGLTQVCGTDAYGSYVWDTGSNQWQQVVNTIRMPTVATGSGSGCTRVAHANSNIIYMYHGDGNMYKSTNRGSSFFQLTGFGTHSINSNAQTNPGHRNCQPKMAVDPNNSDIVYAGTASDGIFRTKDGGNTWSSISGITYSASGDGGGVFVIAFDGSSTTAGSSNICYIHSASNGLYATSAPNGSVSSVTGAATTCSGMSVSTDGVLYLTDTNGTVNKYASGSWTNSILTNAQSVTADPLNAGRAVALFPNCSIQVTTNHGTGWGPNSAPISSTVNASSDIPWLSTAFNGFISSASGAAFSGSTFFIPHGIGVNVCTPPNDMTSTCTFTSQARGIEEIVTNGIVSAPNGPHGGIVLCGWDRNNFYTSTPNVYPSTYAFNPDFCAGWNSDYASSDGSTIATFSDWFSTDLCSTNTAGGSGTWTTFPVPPLFFTVNTSAATTSGNVLHFTNGTLPSYIHVGMGIADLTVGAFNNNDSCILAFTNTTVTVGNTDGAGGTTLITSVGSGDTILFKGSAGGCIAAASPTNIIVSQSNEYCYPRYTKDGGNTWANLSIAGIPQIFTGNTSSGSNIITNCSDTTHMYVGEQLEDGDGLSAIPANSTISSIDSSSQIHISANATASLTNHVIAPAHSGWGFAYYEDYKCFCADRVNANTFFAWNYETNKVYSSTNSGDTWSVVNVTDLSSIHGSTGLNGFTGSLQSVPLNAGNLFLSGAQNFLRSTNAGVNWSTVSGVTDVNLYGFGAPKVGGGGYPAVFIYGTISGTVSLYRSDDNCSTWTNLGIPTTLDGINSLSGDANYWGRVYIGYEGSGWWYGDVY